MRARHLLTALTTCFFACCDAKYLLVALEEDGTSSNRFEELFRRQPGRANASLPHLADPVGKDAKALVASPSPARRTRCRCPPARPGDVFCGHDGVEYASACLARCGTRFGARCRGRCPCQERTRNDSSGCTCWSDHEPVCGADEVQYVSRCDADCLGVRVQCEGGCPCRKHACYYPDDCPERHFGPACGADGLRYDNKCWAECAGVGVHPECPHGVFECVGPDGQCPGPWEGPGLRYDEEGDDDGGVRHDEFEASDEEAERLPCTCQQDYVPTCGSDGEFYTNRCFARCSGAVPICHGECPCTDVEDLRVR